MSSAFPWKNRIFPSLEATGSILGGGVGSCVPAWQWFCHSEGMENTLPVVKSPGKPSAGLGLADPGGIPSGNHNLAQSVSIPSHANPSLCLLLLN